MRRRLGSRRPSGARRLWLITTNDNVDALRFYQRRGFRLVRVHAGAVDRSRAALKPGIPEAGDHGIPLRDELELEMTTGPPPEPVASAADELLALELALARRDEPAIPGGYEAVLAPDFSEIGASGRRWSRAETLEALHAEPPDPSRHDRGLRGRRPRAATWSSRRMTRAASHPTAPTPKPPQLGLAPSRRPLAAPLQPGHTHPERRRGWSDDVTLADNTGLITDFDTPRNGNLGDVHADSALEEPRRATK